MAESVLAKLPLPARVGISVGLLVLAGLAYYVVFYSDIAASIENAQARRGQLERELAQAKEAEQVYQKDLEELAQRRERERELNKILPATTEYPAFLSAVQSVANGTGVELVAWSPESEIKDKFYARVPMKIELTGRFHQIAKFFYGIGQSDRIMNVENISMGRPKLVDQDVYLRVTGLATAFRAVTAEEAPDAAQDRRSKAGGRGR